MLSSLFADKIHKWNSETDHKVDKYSDSQFPGKTEEKIKCEVEISEFLPNSTEVFSREENARIIECF